MRILIEAFGKMEGVVVFPVHPRTRARMADFRITPPSNLLMTDPVSYLDMLVLQRHAQIILTDSGGVQKEACFAGTPCITLRSETEWVETIQSGWNVLAWGSVESILHAVAKQQYAGARVPMLAYGDGYAAARIASAIRGGATQ
jgi:UDP-GlcNAc3NAcA epimerase